MGGTGNEASNAAGILLINKPAGVTSHDVVFDIRRRLHVKTGHAGTLDPFATGLLVVLIGRATRLQRYLLGLPKTYLATARLGWTSDTGDRDGELFETGQVPDDPQISVGDLELPVPSYSAIKVDGQRLYAKARRGEEFEPPTRAMTVYRAQRMQFDGQSAVFEIECSSGTYVRSLVSEIGDAYCDELVRTRVGELRLENSDPECVVEPSAALSHLRCIEATIGQVRAAIHGRDIEVDSLPAEGEAVRLAFSGVLAGVARVRDGRLRPETMMLSNRDEIETA